MCIFFSPLLARLSEGGQTLNKYRGEVICSCTSVAGVEIGNYGNLQSEEKVQNLHHKIQWLGTGLAKEAYKIQCPDT